MEKKIVFKGIEDMPYLPMTLGTTLTNKTGTWKYIRPVYRDKTAPCNEGCPAGEDIEGYMYLVGEGKYEEAWRLILKENPFPAICGRVCYHPCENNCNRGKYDQELAIHSVERFLGDYGLKSGNGIPGPVEKKSQKVAIVGSGPAGLACAYHLARMGYEVTIFEAFPQAGGVLRVGIPAYRLPRDILDLEIGRIQALGVQIKTRVRVGVDISVKKLKDEFDAVFIATGVHKSRRLNVPGEELEGVMSGLEFLRHLNLGKKVHLGKKVAVIGGGNTAMDAARSALRLGSASFIVYRRTRHEMPAIAEEIDETIKEGIDIHFLATPVKITGKNGKVTQMECIKMKLGPPDESGRRRPVPIEGSNFIMEVDNVLTAIGELPDFSFIPEDLKVEGQVITIDETGATSIPGLFAGGDVVDQPHTVVDAIGSGKKAAMAIDMYIKGDNLKSLLDKVNVGHKGTLSMRHYLGELDGTDDVDKDTVVDFSEINLDYFERKPRQTMPELPVAERIRIFQEVNLGLSEESVRKEVERCFNCGVCNMCDNCYVFCPDISIFRRENGYRYQINYDYCKGCGICAYECPRNAITMIREGEED